MWNTLRRGSMERAYFVEFHKRHYPNAGPRGWQLQFNSFRNSSRRLPIRPPKHTKGIFAMDSLHCKLFHIGNADDGKNFERGPTGRGAIAASAEITTVMVHTGHTGGNVHLRNYRHGCGYHPATGAGSRTSLNAATLHVLIEAEMLKHPDRSATGYAPSEASTRYSSCSRKGSCRNSETRCQGIWKARPCKTYRVERISDVNVSAGKTRITRRDELAQRGKPADSRAFRMGVDYAGL